MPETIRRLETADLESVSKLYDDRKSLKELKWLFHDFENPDNYNGFVAVDENNRIMGVIGYCLSEYNQKNEKITGVVPMSWKLAADYKGFAGVQLFKKAISLGRFSFAIDGTDIAQKLYPMFKYHFLLDNTIFYKILNLKNACLSLKKKSKIKTYGFIGYLLPTYLKKVPKHHPELDIKLLLYTGEDYMPEKEYPGVFRKIITKAYIDWLLQCPVLNTHAFGIYNKKEFLGICVLYVQKINHVNRGRIVHLPYLGDDLTIWTAVMGHILHFFENEQCCLVTGLGQHSMNRAAYKSAGFLSPKGYVRSIYLKDNDGIIDVSNPYNLFLQYSEADEGYISL